MREKRGYGSCDPRLAAALFIAVMMDKRLTKEQREKICCWWNEDVKRQEQAKKQNMVDSLLIAAGL